MGCSGGHECKSHLHHEKEYTDNHEPDEVEAIENQGKVADSLNPIVDCLPHELNFLICQNDRCLIIGDVVVCLFHTR